MQLIHRVARPLLAGTCLEPVLSACVGLEDLEAPTVHVPAAPGGSLRLLATVAGSALLEGDGREVRLETGSLAVLAPGWGYRRRINRVRWHLHALLLSGPWTVRLAAACAQAGGVLCVPRPPPAWRRRLVEAVTLLHERPAQWDFAVAARLAELLEVLCCRGGDGLVERTALLVGADPGRGWTVAELAAALGLGASAYAHRFRTEAGEPPQAWLRRRRLDEAARLLAEHPPGAVAELLGFATPFHFSRLFRRRYGLPPSLWRRRLLAHEGI